MGDLPPTFETERLSLIPVDLPFAEAVEQGTDALAQHLGAPVADGFPESPGMYRYVAEMLREDPALARWLAWSMRDRASGTVIGDLGFHGPPTTDRTVEIGYSVAPAWRNRGIATEALAAFLAWAKAIPELTAIRAEAESTNAPSLAILRGLGFVQTGTYVDPADSADLTTFILPLTESADRR